MPTFFQRNHSQKVDLQVCTKGTCSTILIPKNLVDKLHLIKSLQKTHHKSWNFQKGLSKFLSKYRGFLACGNLPFQSKPKLTYQANNLSLVPFKFRPDAGDWFELGCIAYGLGVSRCWLFTYLIELELSGIGEFLSLKKVQRAVATPSVSRPRLIQQITGRRRYINRILHFRL
jgi:hypothetical protein